jgi:hypothetical protein
MQINKRIRHEQTPGERVADASDHFDRLRGLRRTDDAGQRRDGHCRIPKPPQPRWSLPMHPYLSEAQLERICAVVRETLS